LDSYAWALSQNGRHAEARKQLDMALAVGTQDAELLYHAGVIASRLKDRDGAVRLLARSLDVNPQSRVAAASRARLSELGSSKH
jgi:Tfp pilus assembly protein PilF